MLTKRAAAMFVGGVAVLVLFAGCRRATIGGAKVAAAEKPKVGFSFGPAS
jgi:hypothetical protein